MQVKIVAAGLVLVAGAGAGIARDTLLHQGAEAAAEASAHEFAVGRVLPYPDQFLRVAHSSVAQAGGETVVCGLMDASTRAVFAAAHGAGDCPGAVRVLRARIAAGTHSIYVEFSYRDRRSAIVTGGPDATVDGCAIDWRPGLLDRAPIPPGGPGPRLGWFQLRQVGGGGYLAVGYRPCPLEPGAGPATAPPGGTSPTAASSSTSTRAPVPRLLPGYAPGYGGTLAARLARDDGSSACDLFSADAARAFAQAHGAADCAAAATALAGRITDARRYRSPTSAATTQGPRGPVVDACRLRWPALGGPVSAPGPQIGLLELETPPGATGYWVAGYRRC
ncbi:hypothetical protein [Actinokineospora terrae]|uniref:hypothetical protein n=1 Tax=Actinokineospora terrae TaxID=155974 RepID=UPI000B8044BE|nr:hypothetical protein [Actinokineospora terrae]